MNVRKIFEKVEYVIMAMLAVLSISLIIRGVSMKRELERAKSEIVVVTDSLKEYKDRTGELWAEKESYIVSRKDLEKINSDLADEVKKLKDNPVVVEKTVVEMRVDTVTVEGKAERDTTGNLFVNKYDWKDKYLSMDISHTLNTGTLESLLAVNSIVMAADIYTTILEKDKHLYLIAKSTNPYLQINNVSGGLVESGNSRVLRQHFSKEYKWSVGIGAGIGVVYDFGDGNLHGGPGVTLSVNRTLFHF